MQLPTLNILRWETQAWTIPLRRAGIWKAAPESLNNPTGLGHSPCCHEQKSGGSYRCFGRFTAYGRGVGRKIRSAR